MGSMDIRYSTFPRTEPPPDFISEVMFVFNEHKSEISTGALKKGLTSDQVLSKLRKGLIKIDFAVEMGKRKKQKIERPVFYGENGLPTVRYEIDAYHDTWKCGLEIEAGRAWMGNAVYRDLIQALVMVEVEYLILAVPNAYKYNSKKRIVVSNDYDNTINLADALYGHSRFKLPYKLVVIGY